MDYITFGQTVIEAYIKAIQKFLQWSHLESLSVLNVIVWIIILKVLIALAVSFTYYLDFSSLMSKLKLRFIGAAAKNVNVEVKKQTFKESTFSAFSDLLSLRFLFSFIFISLLIYFFSDVSKAKFLTTISRGLFLAWLGFLFARRIDFERIVHFLEKHDLGFVAESLKQALQLVLRNK
jgi:hypothetical protein